jgi:hypothetical protein
MGTSQSIRIPSAIVLSPEALASGFMSTPSIVLGAGDRPAHRGTGSGLTVCGRLNECQDLLHAGAVTAVQQH